MTFDPQSLAPLIAEAARQLQAGELVVFPTETVYGLGADATNERAVKRIFEIKGRPATNPLIVHLAKFEDIATYCDFEQVSHSRQISAHLLKLSALWPGPLSVVLPRRKERVTPSVSAGGDTVAIRIPNHPVALALLTQFGGPIAAPSANPSEYISPTTADHVRANLGSKIACILDGGPCRIGLESTVLSLIEPIPRILRPGAITRAEIQQLLEIEVLGGTPADEQREIKLSPGLLAKHYAPRTPVRLLRDITQIPSLPPRIGAILFYPQQLPFPVTEQRILSAQGDLEEIGARLFAALRELDELKFDLIVVDTCKPTGLGEAIMDRLLRASA